MSLLYIALNYYTRLCAMTYVAVCTNRSILTSRQHNTNHCLRTAFVVQLGSEQQSINNKATFGVFLPSPAFPSATAPAWVSLVGCRATAQDCVRLRCIDPKCQFRTDMEDEGEESSSKLPENLEIPEDDLEIGDFDPRDSMEEEQHDGHDEHLQALDQRKGTAEPDAKCIRNVFPFAFPVAYHGRTLDQVLGASSLTHLVVVTRTAHPGLLVAARQRGLEVICLLEGASPHSQGHGSMVLEGMLIKWKFPLAQKELGAVNSKRVAAKELTFIVVNAPATEQQVIHIHEVTPDPRSAWRAGLNRSLHY